MVTTIVVLIAFLSLFILYPLAVLLVDSVYGEETGLTLDIFKRIFDMHTFRTSITNTLKVGLTVVLLAITLLMYLVQTYVLEAKTAAILTGKASRARMLIEDKSVTIPLTILCSMIALFVIMMYICVPFGALFNTWGYDFTLTTRWFVRVFEKYKGLKAFTDSFLLSLASAPITALLSMIISYLVVKRKFRAKGFIEFVSMLAMAVPGTVLGIGYIRGFVNGVFGTGCPIRSSSWKRALWPRSARPRRSTTIPQTNSWPTSSAKPTSSGASSPARRATKVLSPCRAPLWMW